MNAQPIASFLAPISDEAPFGTYLKDDRALYRSLRNSFNAAQTSYRALSETPDSLNDRELRAYNSEAWQNLSDAAAKTISVRSKDTEVLCWYLAAQVHLDNPLERLLSGMLTAAELAEQSWDQLHPIPPAEKLRAEGSDAQQKEVDALRLRSFVQLFGEVPAGGLLYLPLTNLPLIAEITYGSFLSAERDGGLRDLKASVTGSGADQNSGLTESVSNLLAFQEALSRLDTVLRSVAGRANETPVQVSNLSKLVEDLLRMLRVLTEGSRFVWPQQEIHAEEAIAPEASGEPAATDATEPTGRSAPAARPQMDAGAAGNREDALALLEELIGYFRKTEPHSPVHTVLARALRWARMPLPDVMSEVLGADSEGMARLSMMAGLESANERIAVKRPAQVVPPAQQPKVEPEPHAGPAPEEAPPTAPDASAEGDKKIASFEW